MIAGTCRCGQARWSLGPTPDRITACNCRLCSRYGALWAYGDETDITVEGTLAAYTPDDLDDTALQILFCRNCACVVAWRAIEAEANGRRRFAVNVRLAPFEDVADLALRRLDGRASFREMTDGARRVREVWF